MFCIRRNYWNVAGDESTKISNVYITEPPFNNPWLNVLPHLMFNLNVSKSNLVLNFLHSLLKSIDPKSKLWWGSHCIQYNIVRFSEQELWVLLSSRMWSSVVQYISSVSEDASDTVWQVSTNDLEEVAVFKNRSDTLHAAYSPKMVVLIYETTRHHIPEDSNYYQ
jgi:hypothetical protein